MIVLLSCEDGEEPRHPIYLVCSDTFGEILYFVQHDRSFVAGGA